MTTKPEQTDNNGKYTVRAVFKIGGYSNHLSAAQDALDYGKPSAFANRSNVFPNPRNFGVTFKTISSTWHTWVSGDVFNQYYVRLEVDITGNDKRKVDEWLTLANNAIKLTTPVTHSQTGERAEHLRSMREKRRAADARRKAKQSTDKPE